MRPASRCISSVSIQLEIAVNHCCCCSCYCCLLRAKWKVCSFVVMTSEGIMFGLLLWHYLLITSFPSLSLMSHTCRRAAAAAAQRKLTVFEVCAVWSLLLSWQIMKSLNYKSHKTRPRRVSQLSNGLSLSFEPLSAPFRLAGNKLWQLFQSTQWMCVCEGVCLPVCVCVFGSQNDFLFSWQFSEHISRLLVKPKP